MPFSGAFSPTKMPVCRGGKTGARRSIEAALAPARDQFKPADLKILTKALGFIMGPESVVVAKDVLQLDDAETRKLKRWVIRALVEAARKPGAQG